jgi:hypothetical protein
VKFAVEGWSPAYGIAMDDAALIEASAEVDPGVEVPLADWAPRQPDSSLPVPASIGFVDGVRRIDARVWITEGDLARPGVCASVAAGLVVTDGAEAHVVDSVVSRGVFAAARDAGPIRTRHGTYELHPAADDTSEGLYLAVHEQMTALELELSERAGCDLIVFDGPLRGRRRQGGVGYVKTQQVQYLVDEAQVVVSRLEAGQRTPLFLIGQRGFTRWSWYVRLPGPRTHPFSGIVRCEVVAAGTVAEATLEADVVTSLLPRFASEAHKDARAPQNLYPIAGLENELRRRLGDQEVLERGLRLAAAQPRDAITA